jgi:hypothetical protein
MVEEELATPGTHSPWSPKAVRCSSEVAVEEKRRLAVAMGELFGHAHDLATMGAISRPGSLRVGQ